MAEKTIHIGVGDSVTGGDVVVRQIEPWTTADGGLSTEVYIGDGGLITPPTPEPQLVVGEGSNVGVSADCASSASIVSATSISLGATGCIGRAQTNVLSTSGANAASETTFPTVPLRPLPLAPLPPASNANVTVPAGGAMALSPGNYGVIHAYPVP